MALRASQLGHQDWCSVEKICNTVNRKSAACRNLHHWQGKVRTDGHFLRRLIWCPNSVPKQSVIHVRRRVTIISAMAVSAGGGAATPSPLSDHILDCVSCFLLNKAKELLGSSKYNLLQPKLLDQLLKNESFAISLVREGLVFGTLGLMYCQVSNSCRGLCRMVSATKRVADLEYKNSLFHAATAPLRLLIIVWASTHMLRVIAVSAHLQLYISREIFVKGRGMGIVVSGTWFLLTWKQHLIDNLTSKHMIDQPRAVAFDKLVSLVLYFVAATCVAHIVGFAIGSLLAVGGFSGIALGLAAKEVVSNVFGGAVIFLTRPFVIGERIKAGAVSGQVQDIGYLQTRILGFDGVPLLVPNQAFIDQVITNFSRANSKLLEASFYLHNQDVFLVDKITAQVVDYLKTHPQVEKQRATPMCYLKNMGHWGPEISIMCTINFGGGSFFAVRQEIMVKVAKIIVDVLGEDAPYFRNSVTNLMWELRMHLLYAGQGLQPGGV